MKSTKIFQILKLVLIAALLIITPLLSPSLRSTYLYFIVNILILVVVSEAGLLSLFSDSRSNYNKGASVLKPLSVISELSHEDELEKIGSDHMIEKCPLEKIVGEEEKVMMIERSLSSPSIFFIGGCDKPEDQTVEEVNDDEGEEIGEVNGQELFQKSETFIGNFYKQLKMQKEESWKSLHDIYHKAF